MASKYLPILEKWKKILKLGDWSIQIKHCSIKTIQKIVEVEHVVLGGSVMNHIEKTAVIYLLNDKQLSLEKSENHTRKYLTQEAIIIHELLHMILDNAKFKNSHEEEVVINQLTQGLLNAQKN